jgi:hypothetical protein
MFDTNGTLTAQSLSKAHRKPLRGVACGVLVAIGISLLLPYGAGSAPVKEYVDYKTYALYLLDWNKEQHICLLKLYGKESAWNPAASNGSHYGIPQGNSEWLKDQDGYAQVRWGLDYIGNRYGEPCIALDHWRRFNWH